MAYASGDKNGKPFEALWDAIHDLETAISLDDDADSSNEDQTLSGTGEVVLSTTEADDGGGTVTCADITGDASLCDGDDAVVDNDNDPSNELQTLSVGSDITLSQGGGSISCEDITGGAGLCDGVDEVGSSSHTIPLLSNVRAFSIFGNGNSFIGGIDVKGEFILLPISGTLGNLRGEVAGVACTIGNIGEVGEPCNPASVAILNDPFLGTITLQTQSAGSLITSTILGCDFTFPAVTCIDSDSIPVSAGDKIRLIFDQPNFGNVGFVSGSVTLTP